MIILFKKREGVTLLELLVAIVFAGIIFIFGGTLIRNLNYSRIEHARLEQLKVSTQMVIQRITAELDRAYSFFSNGTSYYDKIVWDSVLTPPPPCSSAIRLPTVTEDLVLNPENPNFDSSAFGNALFFAARDTFIQVYYKDPLGIINVSDTNYVIDIYRFRLFYLGKDVRNPLRPENYSLVLTRWESERVADFTQLVHFKNVDKIYSGRLNAIIDSLKNKGITHAWDPEESNADSAFYNLDDIVVKDPESSPPDPNFQFVRSSTEKLYPPGTYGTIAVAFNRDVSFPIEIPVSLYIKATGSGDCRFPNGFEVAIGGRQPGRKILLRITLATWGRSRVLASSYQTITTKPEY